MLGFSPDARKDFNAGGHYFGISDVGTQQIVERRTWVRDAL